MSADSQSRLVEVGQASLTGWRGRVARSAAKPIADHTRFSREQVEAFLGFLLLGIAIYLTLRPVISALRR
jgi:hypothetical protein